MDTLHSVLPGLPTLDSLRKSRHGSQLSSAQLQLGPRLRANELVGEQGGKVGHRSTFKTSEMLSRFLVASQHRVNQPVSRRRPLADLPFRLTSSALFVAQLVTRRRGRGKLRLPSFQLISYRYCRRADYFSRALRFDEPLVRPVPFSHHTRFRLQDSKRIRVSKLGWWVDVRRIRGSVSRLGRERSDLGADFDHSSLALSPYHSSLTRPNPLLSSRPSSAYGAPSSSSLFGPSSSPLPI